MGYAERLEALKQLTQEMVEDELYVRTKDKDGDRGKKDS